MVKRGGIALVECLEESPWLFAVYFFPYFQVNLLWVTVAAEFAGGIFMISLLQFICLGLLRYISAWCKPLDEEVVSPEFLKHRFQYLQMITKMACHPPIALFQSKNFE